MQFGVSFDYSSQSWEHYYELKAESREYRRQQRALQQQQLDGAHDSAAVPEERDEVRYVEPPPHHGHLQQQHGQEDTSSGSGLVMPHPSALLAPQVAVACDNSYVDAGNNIGEDARQGVVPVKASGTNKANNVLFSSDHFIVGAKGKLLAEGGGGEQEALPDDLTSQNSSNAPSDNGISATNDGACNDNAEEISTGAAAPVRRIRTWLRNLRGRGGKGGGGSSEGTHGGGQGGVQSAESTPNAVGAEASSVNKRDGWEKPVWLATSAFLPVTIGVDSGGVLGYHDLYGCSAGLASALEGLLSAWSRNHRARGGGYSRTLISRVAACL